MDLKGSRTEGNLVSALAGESQAAVKYEIYAEKARKEGYRQIAAIFQETAKNELAHATVWMETIYGGSISSTTENLASAQEGEHFEWSEMYAEYAKVAREEGFQDIARRFDQVASIEKAHDQRYTALKNNLSKGEVFKKPQPVAWVCRNCGFIYTGMEAPAKCPVCSHPQAFFQKQAENY